MDKFLECTDIIDWKNPAIFDRATQLGKESENDTARACFEWVRDQIPHCRDVPNKTPTCRASDVLAKRTGWCFAKSHLLAALLRANGIPVGFCYQRLRYDDQGIFTLHGINAIKLQEFGWYRVDARGNKPGVDAQFCPPEEKLAWPIQHQGEFDSTEILAAPLPSVITYLKQYGGSDAGLAHLPDNDTTL